MLSTAPFLVHFLIETPAALTFILRPSSQLPNPSPPTILILQSLGGLLLATNFIALVFLRREFDETSRLVALAFAFWHLWPCHRAWMRLRSGIDTEDTGRTLGGPVVHLGVHAMLLVLFITSSLSGQSP